MRLKQIFVFRSSSSNVFILRMLSYAVDSKGWSCNLAQIDLSKVGEITLSFGGRILTHEGEFFLRKRVLYNFLKTLSVLEF